MATTIHALGDTIKIDKAFVSGKDRIAVNEEVVFEGKLGRGVPRNVTVGTRAYAVEVKALGGMGSAVAFQLTIREGNELVHSGIYDEAGKPVSNVQQAKQSVAIQTCATVGGVIGVVTMMSLNAATGVVPGGAIGGAIGGGVGAAAGYAVGSLIFGPR